MYSGEPHRKPNAPIFLEDIIITHINGQALPEPCPARVTLYLSPRITCRVESDALPVSLLHSQQKPFSITTNNSCTAWVFLNYNLNDFYPSSKEFLSGFLVPYKSPCSVLQSDTQMQSISFNILNFQKFHSHRDNWIELDGTNRRLGAAELEHENLRIQITEDPAFSENRKSLNRDDGYAITHAGLIQLSDDKTLSVKDAECILRGVRAFLTFACGSACGLTLVKAIGQNNKERVLEWGTSHTEPWVQRGTTWLPVSDGGNSLTQLFPGFWSLYKNPDWRDTITTVIDWYANCNNSPFHIGVILAQAALEALANKIVVRQKGERTDKWLRRMLTDCGIDEKIPDSCNALKQLSNSIRNTIGNDHISDGPGVLVEIRNDLVHSRKKYDISAEAQMDAQKLGCWYIELVMLKKFDYHSRYRNRLKVTDENPYENVPWSI